MKMPVSDSTSCSARYHTRPAAARLFVTYEARGAGGHRFRNSEIVTVRGSQIVEVEVYFGWDLPHKARAGGFVEKA